MSHANAFRSHIMQQFAVAARGQSRPPIALSSYLGTRQASNDNDARLRSRGRKSSYTTRPRTISSNNIDVPDSSKASHGTSTSTGHAASRRYTSQNLHDTKSKGSPVSLKNSNENSKSSQNKSTVVKSEQSSTSLQSSIDNNAAVSFLTYTSSSQDLEDDLEDCNNMNHKDKDAMQSSSFQSILKSRRTISNFLPMQRSNNNILEDISQKSDLLSSTPTMPSMEFIKEAIERAAECAICAPNHKRTEPLTLKRLLSTHASINENNTEEKILTRNPRIDALADIAKEVSLRRGLSAGKNLQQATRDAQAKGDKWRYNIPAFLVAYVSNQPCQYIEEDIEQNRVDPYDELPFSPPKTEMQLEDYASACAAVQNILLSLHSEGLGAKWATGPVIRCKAFRDLMSCKHDDLVVGLLMIGVPHKIPRAPRRRRELVGDTLQDL